MRILVLILLPLFLVSCVPASQFGQGFTQEAFKQGTEILAESLGDRIDGVGEKIERLPAPAPHSPANGTLWGGLGALVAYVVGSLGKGWVRKNIKNG